MAVLHHLVEGSGPAVVLVHAGVADLRMWDALAGDLARRHTVVRCDLRGYGGTPVSAGASYSDAEDVLALVDELDVGAFALVGASYGGHVAVQVATAAPERVTRLLLLAPAGDLATPDEGLRELWAEEARLLEAGDVDAAAELNVAGFLGPDADDATRDRLRTMQREALARQLAAGEFDNHEMPVAFESLTMPSTVVVGAHDRPFFLQTARALADRLPACRLVELPWAGHLPVLERPEEAALLVRGVLGD